MEFLGVGPGELLLIAILLLVVVGPERLPGLARQAGKFVVMVRGWLQKSPDAAMVMRARQEIEQELSVLRASLAEVQSARNEVMEVTRQLNQTVNTDIIGSTREGIQAVQQPGTVARGSSSPAAPATASTANGAAPAEPTIAPPRATADTAAAGEPAPLAETGQPTGTVDMAPAGETAPNAPTALLDIPADGAPNPADDASDETSDVALLKEQMGLLMIEMRAMQDQLRRRGLLDEADPAAIAEHNEEQVHVEQ